MHAKGFTNCQLGFDFEDTPIGPGIHYTVIRGSIVIGSMDMACPCMLL